jgi:hypothetical protein
MAWATIWFGIACYALGGLNAAVLGTILLVIATGTMIWRRRSERRHRPRRAVAVVATCLSIVLGGYFAFEIASLFSSPGWESF